MKRQLLLALGCILLIAGWMSAFLMRAFPQQSDFFFLVPALLLGIGVGVTLKVLSAMRTSVVVILMAIVSVIAVNQVYPDGKISVTGFLQRMQNEVPKGKPVKIEVLESDRQGVFASDRTLNSMVDLRVQLFARIPGGGRMLAFDDAGRLYVTIPKLGAVYQLTDLNGDGFADQSQLFHFDMDRPHGLVWDKDKLYIAETSRLLQLADKNKDNQVDEVNVVLDDLPDDGGHWTRSLAKGADGFLYLSIGSRCNACEENDLRRATVMRVNPVTGETEIFAKGLRNSVGLTFSPDGKILWGSDNGRDMLGDDLPPDEINRLEKDGDYGWPYCYGNRIPDPDLGSMARCKETVSAAVELQAHSAPLGIAFGDGLKAPSTYQKSMFVAFHGSWNRSVPTGYKLIRIPFTNGQPEYAKEFLFGWFQDGKAWGRPVAPVVGPDGSLYLSDDLADAIYRISWIE
ncbi:sorbosone dehydrogenase family protein [Malonomonas rubra]|uniref:PQQ-dependent sugar dehydrogenase n=1 Tax=Malonomonas rubra TaxID=57040 RepID=UPI0026F342BC|nr:PQQ-dependent sugar dehydrogenase [Malonomonas rubra]